MRTWLADGRHDDEHSTRSGRVKERADITLEQRIRKAEADLFETSARRLTSVSRPRDYRGARPSAVARQRSATGSPPRRVPQRRCVGALVQRAAGPPSARGGPSRSRAVGPRRLSTRSRPQRARQLIDDIFDALELDDAPVVGHSLGGMLALWYAAAGTGRISRLVAIGEPAVALPGVRVRMPLSLLTVRGLGRRCVALTEPPPRLSTPARPGPRPSRGRRRAGFTDRRSTPIRPSAREREDGQLADARDRPLPPTAARERPHRPRARARSQFRRCSSGGPTPPTSPPSALGPRSSRSQERRFTRCPAHTVLGSWTPNAVGSSSRPTSLPQ